MKLHFGWLPALVAAMGLVLTACSGNEAQHTLIVDPESSRALTGGTVLDETGPEIKRGMATLTAKADTVVVGDIHTFGKRGPERQEATCRGDICILRPGFTSPAGIVDKTGAVTAGNFSVELTRFTPVMLYNGVRMVHEEATYDADIDGYGGWLDHSYFFIQLNIDSDPADLERVSYSLGTASASVPEGDASWTGAMTGVDISAPPDRDTVVQGKADISFALDTMTVDVMFTDIVELASGEARRDMSWLSVAVTNDEFRAGSGTNRIEGRFYGSNHDEAGGVFERDQVLGAFGANRVD